MPTITKAEREAAAEATHGRNPDGSDLHFNVWKLMTVRQAETTAVRNLFYIVSKETVPDFVVLDEHIAHATRDTEKILIALAHRNNTTVEEERDRLMVAAEKKLKRAAKARERRMRR